MSGSLIDAISLTVYECLDTPRESTAQAIYVVGLVDLCTTSFEAYGVLLSRLLPLDVGNRDH